MSQQEFFIQRPSINPTIYAYEFVDVSTHKGYVKVGYTERDVETVCEKIVQKHKVERICENFYAKKSHLL